MTAIATATALLAKREALELAKAELEVAEQAFKQDLARSGASFIVVDGVKVAVVKGERPNYSVDVLKELVSDKVFKTVTRYQTSSGW